MATRKIKDLAVKTGSYTDNQGQQKNRYENIGSLMESDKGMFILLKRTFNPAGVEVEPGKDQILVSVFDLKDGNAAPAQREPAPAPVRHDDGPLPDIPF